MSDIKNCIDDLNRHDKAKFIIDMFHRIIMHHVLWFTEVKHQIGMDRALDILDKASKQSYEIQMKRLGKLFNFKMQDGVPEPLLNLSHEALNEVMDNIGINWLANDGVWFQAVEFKHGMNDAKRCNDSCWANFSPVEANAIKTFLNLPENPGLEGLKRALKFRLYTRVNKQSIVDETPNSFVFQMNHCRVQDARKRKGLDDYPCKSAGLVEYPYFARSIDSRIKTECVGCPPDQHPEEWFCAWRFTI